MALSIFTQQQIFWGGNVIWQLFFYKGAYSDQKGLLQDKDNLNIYIFIYKITHPLNHLVVPIGIARVDKPELSLLFTHFMLFSHILIDYLKLFKSILTENIYKYFFQAIN